jgi:hypothetical protein
MLPISITFLAFQGAVFLIWIFLAFRWLFALRADAAAESSSALPGLGSTLRAFRGGLVDERYGKERVRLGFLTFVLVVLSLAQFLFSGLGNP